MPYRISYEASSVPAELPEGASVEHIGRSFPVKLSTPYGRSFEVKRDDVGAVSGVFLYVRDTSAVSAMPTFIPSRLPGDTARELAHSLLEAIGDPVPGEETGEAAPARDTASEPVHVVGTRYRDGDPEPPPRVTEVADAEGDFWYRRMVVGWPDRWKWTMNNLAPAVLHVSDGRDWDDVTAHYGPVTARKVHPW